MWCVGIWIGGAVLRGRVAPHTGQNDAPTYALVVLVALKMMCVCVCGWVLLLGRWVCRVASFRYIN